MINRKCLITIFLVVTLILPSILSAQEIQSSHTIEIKGSVDNVIVRDINSDGIQEIILQQGRGLHIFRLHDKENASQVIFLPSDASMYDIIKNVIVYMNDKGVNLLPIMKSSSETVIPLIKTPTIFRNNNFISPLYKSFIFNINDKYQTAIIPTLNGFSFYCSDNTLFQPQKEECFSREWSLSLSPNAYQGRSVFEPLTIKMDLPPLVTEDLNNDKNKDFITLIGNEVGGLIFEEYNEDISFIEIGNLFEQKKENSHSRSFPSPIRDINNDGCADAVDVDISEGVIYIYINQFLYRHEKKDQTPDISDTPFWLDTPSQIIRTNNWIVSHRLVDLNNDGLEDLIVVQMDKVGIIGGLQAIMSKTLEWEIAVYLARNTPDISRLYPQSPDYIRRLSVPFSIFYTGPLSFTSGQFSLPYTVSLDGDFNGDKINDLLLSGAKEGTMEVYLGNKQQVFNKQVSKILTLSRRDGFRPQNNNISISDLNNDGKSDIIIPFTNTSGSDPVSLYEIFLSY